MSHTYILSWDQLGLEACINVSDIEKRKMWAALKNEDTSRDPDVGSIVNALLLRARFNHQRHYEIYAIDTEESITEQQLKDMFDESPQSSADLIRARGRKLYSDRAGPDERIKIR